MIPLTSHWLVAPEIIKRVKKLGSSNKKSIKNTMNNITPSIEAKMNRGLYRIPEHPLCIVKEKVFAYFEDLARIEIDNPYVAIQNNFDKLRVPQNHPSRSP